MLKPLFALAAIAPLLGPGTAGAGDAPAGRSEHTVAQVSTPRDRQTSSPPSAAEAAAPEVEPRVGGDWPGSFTGRGVPDPTGTRLFKPAVSRGTGPRL